MTASTLPQSQESLPQLHLQVNGKALAQQNSGAGSPGEGQTLTDRPLLLSPISCEMRPKSPPKKVSDQPSLLPAIQVPYRERGRSLDGFSPVMENGSFQFDRMLKSGKMDKRMRRTKKWKPIYLVLRPGVLSFYKKSEESCLHGEINVADITTIIPYTSKSRRKSKGKTDDYFHFRLFTHSRNYRLRVTSEAERRAWLDILRKEARVDQDELFLADIGSGGVSYPRKDRSLHTCRDRGFSSCSEVPDAMTNASDSIRPRPNTTSTDHPGTEIGSYSEFSDNSDAFGERLSQISLSKQKTVSSRDTNNISSIISPSIVPPSPLTCSPRPNVGRNLSQLSGLETTTDPERVILQGYLECFKRKQGVKQWKKLWAVLREKTLSLYPDEKEYKPCIVISMPSVVNCTEIDPVSDKKQHCMQIITNEKDYRFNAPDEDSLARWLGSMKSVLTRRKNSIGSGSGKR
ncbi:MAG: hypothetical protein M1834_004736 [Cirrosporium novae-zelandiae]|nr:MAG: hypothetical protein M1834_004736 [Cirrosporium novae-zelandiae]